MLLARYAYDQFQDYDEGRLTGIRTALARRSTLAILADSLGLGSHMFMGRSERKPGGRGRLTVLAEGFEALVAAIYLDRGLETAERFLESTLHHRVPELLIRAGGLNAKSRLQEFAQASLRIIPTYALVSSTGPAHDTRFMVEVVAGPYSGIGVGTSKRGAEQDAAKRLLETMPDNLMSANDANHAGDGGDRLDHETGHDAG